MPETQLDEELHHARAKRKTTYSRDHPVENPKPPKRTKAEIQQAAKERKEADQARKAAAEAEKQKKILDAEEKRKLSARRIATVEDSVQRLQKERQSRSERPDLKTMATYQEQLRKKKELEIEPIDDQEEEPEVDELQASDDDMYITDPPQFPPESTVDTDSDGVRLGLSEDEEDTYMPSPGSKNGEDEDDGPESEDSMVLLQRNRQKRLDKKKKKVSVIYNMGKS